MFGRIAAWKAVHEKYDVLSVYNQLAAETYTMGIGSIADISCIVPVSQVLNHPIRVVLCSDGNWRLLTKTTGE